MTKEETTWGKDFAELIFNLNTKDIDGTNNYISLSQETELKQFISKLISQEREKWNESVIKMLEDTDVQMSVNGDVSQDEIAMAKFIYKAHIKHIIKKIGSAIIPPNPINGTLPSETDSAIK